jgi:hypothetical protein
MSGVPKWWATAQKWAAMSSERAAGLFSTAAIVGSFSKIIKGIIKSVFSHKILTFKYLYKYLTIFILYKNDLKA